MKCRTVQDGKVAHFFVEGDVDELGAQEIKARFEGLNLTEIETMLFDFAQVTRIGSAGLGKLLLFYKKLAAVNATMTIENANAEIRGLLIELNLDTLFAIR